MRRKATFRKIPEWIRTTKIKVGVEYNFTQESRGLGECEFVFYKDGEKVDKMELDCDQLQKFADVTNPTKITDEWHEIK